MNAPERGAIRHKEAYERGKNLDHSAWQRGDKPLPRLITPSDVDMCFDNGGRILCCELSSQAEQWSELGRGQQMLYEALGRSAPHLSVLCTHRVPLSAERPIDTRNDVQSFQIMLFHNKPVFSRVISGEYWEKFVMEWFADPASAKRRCLEKIDGF